MQAIVEEVNSSNKGGKSSKKKERFLQGVVTPASPMYAYGKMYQAGSAAKESAFTAPIIAISNSVNGYQVSPPPHPTPFQSVCPSGCLIVHDGQCTHLCRPLTASMATRSSLLPSYVLLVLNSSKCLDSTICAEHLKHRQWLLSVLSTAIFMLTLMLTSQGSSGNYQCIVSCSPTGNPPGVCATCAS